MTDEEKAKEWVRTNSGYSTKEFHGQKAIEAYLAGAEFGYNKANEWRREAEDSFKCKKVLYKWETDKHSYIGGFRDGATFGYNEANEWCYPSKGEYPKECENVLCYCVLRHRVDVKFYCVGHTIIGGDNKIRWWSSDRSEKLNVYAWKDIIPPVLPKECE